MNILRNRALTIFCSALIIASMVLVPATEAFAGKNDQKIENAQNKIEANEKKQEANKDKIEVLEEQIINTNDAVDKMQAEVDAARVNLQKKKEELDQGNKDLNARLRNIYKSGSLGFVDVILSSGSVSELFSNLEMVKYIFKNDQAVVEQLEKDYEEVKKMEESLTAKEKALKAEVQKFNASKSALASQNKKLENQNEKLEDDIAEWQKANTDVQVQINNTVSSGGGYQGPAVSVSGLVWPVPASHSISSYYGWRTHPIYGDKRFHYGIDIPAPAGSAVLAMNSGKVITAGWHNSYGNYIIIDHGGGMTTLYAHNSSLAVSVGQYVTKGQRIAGVGTTGSSTGNHLHFEVRVNGSTQNPLSYVS